MMANRFRRSAAPLGFAVTAQAALFLGWAAGEATAQEISPRDVQRGMTVNTRPRPDYDPLGVRLGGFRLDSLVEIAPGFDSNLFGRKNNVESDGFVDQNVALNLRSDWTTHAVGAEATMNARQYFSTSQLDYQDWGVGGFGRYDFSAYTSVEGRYRHSREHLDVYSFDVQSAGIAQPVPYDSDEVTVTGNTRFNRVGLLGTGVYRTYRFEDVTIGGVNNQTSLNDFNTAIGALGVSYAVAQGRSITSVVRLQDIAYTNSISSNRNSFTWEALLGFEYDFDGVWSGRLAVGWRNREYEGPGIKPLEGLAVEGQLTWVPTQLTTVRFNVARTIEESIRRDAVSYQRLQGGVAVDHEFRRNIILGADFRADRRDYQSPNQSATDALLTLTARYLLNRNVQIIGSYSHSRRLDSSGGLAEYDRNLVQLRLRFAI
jgi:hypothetical protein